MTRQARIALIVVGVLGLGWLVYTTARKTYFAPRAELIKKIDAANTFIRAALGEQRSRPSLDDRLAAFVDQTLGSDLESVDHELRSRLNRIGEEIGLESLSVSTGPTAEVLSPAQGEFKRRGIDRQYRDEIDFVEVEASISGETDFEHALRLIHRIEAEPWLKRIDQVRLTPRANGSRFVIHVRLTTLFLPGQDPGEQTVEPYDHTTFGRYVTLVNHNPFHRPADSEPVAEQPAPEPPPTARYASWNVTGIARSPRGVEVWLTNGQTSESRVLAVGENWEGLTLVWANGESARFSVDGTEFQVTIGGRLTPPSSKEGPS